MGVSAMKTTAMRWSLIGTMTMAVGSAFAQAPATTAQFDPAAMRAAMEAFQKVPDSVGTGKYPAIKQMLPSLPNHVIYQPKDLSALGADKLGVVAWGNGGCSADGAGGRLHLEEIASHGYLVIAPGTILSGPGSAPQAPPPAPPAGAPNAIPPPATHPDSLVQAIDWALAENSRINSPFYHRINPAQGFAFQRVYTDDRSIDESMAVENHDVVMVPRGYHPVTMPHAYDGYYLNVMAGPTREWHFKNDPAHEWMLKA